MFTVNVKQQYNNNYYFGVSCTDSLCKLCGNKVSNSCVKKLDLDILVLQYQGCSCLDIFTLTCIYHFSSLSPSLWETARYRLKCCLKGPLNPKQPTNQPTSIADIFLYFIIHSFCLCLLKVTELDNHFNVINNNPAICVTRLVMC